MAVTSSSSSSSSSVTRHWQPSFQCWDQACLFCLKSWIFHHKRKTTLPFNLHQQFKITSVWDSWAPLDRTCKLFVFHETVCQVLKTEQQIQSFFTGQRQQQQTRESRVLLRFSSFHLRDEEQERDFVSLLFYVSRLISVSSSVNLVGCSETFKHSSVTQLTSLLFLPFKVKGQFKSYHTHFQVFEFGLL